METDQLEQDNRKKAWDDYYAKKEQQQEEQDVARYENDGNYRPMLEPRIEDVVVYISGELLRCITTYCVLPG